MTSSIRHREGVDGPPFGESGGEGDVVLAGPYHWTELPRGLRARLSLFQTDPHCYWCGCTTTLVLYGRPGRNGAPQPGPLTATLDHYRSRNHPDGDHSEYLVLACNECNNLRNALELKVNTERPSMSRHFVERLAVALLLWHANGHLSVAFPGLGGGSSPNSQWIRRLMALQTITVDGTWWGVDAQIARYVADSSRSGGGISVAVPAAIADETAP